MKIKEAAQYCGLTEKAIRLYETKGLIHPKTEEKNGRTFREYDDETIRTLLTVGTLRRADFSMEQIGLMQQSPERIPEVFSAYCEEVKENAQRLDALSRVMESMDLSGDVTLAEFADRLAVAMMPEGFAATLTGENATAAEPPVIHFHHYVWDEEGTREEKEDAYRRFLQKQARREKVEDIVFALPRKLGAGWRWIRERVDRRIRDENKKVKKTVKLSVVFLMVCGILLNGLLNAERKFDKVQLGCAYDIFFAMHDVVYTLRNTVRTGEYTYGHSETMVRNLAIIDEANAMGEFIYHSTIRRGFDTFCGWKGLIDAVGCTYGSIHNGKRVGSILYDGMVSDKELEFLTLLLADLEEVYGIMLGEDGLNRRGDLDYPLIRKRLNQFAKKWGEWSVSVHSESPYDLLNAE